MYFTYNNYNHKKKNSYVFVVNIYIYIQDIIYMFKVSKNRFSFDGKYVML